MRAALTALSCSRCARKWQYAAQKKRCGGGFSQFARALPRWCQIGGTPMASGMAIFRLSPPPRCSAVLHHHQQRRKKNCAVTCLHCLGVFFFNAPLLQSQRRRPDQKAFCHSSLIHTFTAAGGIPAPAVTHRGFLRPVDGNSLPISALKGPSPLPRPYSNKEAWRPALIPTRRWGTPRLE